MVKGTIRLKEYGERLVLVNNSVQMESLFNAMK
jgi:hypothetical protein